MKQVIAPARRLAGSLRLPGDKSISHRYAMIASIADGESRIRNYSTGADCASTLRCLESLGVAVTRDDQEVKIEGRGLFGLTSPAGPLDAGNSGSTIRMLSGILAAQRFSSTIGGDESLSRRPMDRIIRPLSAMGAVLKGSSIEGKTGAFPPLTIEGRALKSIDYTLPVASAQVKTCVLFAGLHCDGSTSVTEPIQSRDHTELALREFGAQIEVSGGTIRVAGKPRLAGRSLTVASDLSSAAFFLVAALLVPGSQLVIQDVGLNPTRTPLLDFLAGGGADLQILETRHQHGERIGSLQIKASPFHGGLIRGETTAALIDEIPALAVLGAASESGLEIQDASELRVKETDRIATVVENLRRMGISVEERPDGLKIPGTQKFRAAKLDSFGDHRIAMAFGVAALAADGECEIEGADSASVSFPEFWSLLGQLSRS